MSLDALYRDDSSYACVFQSLFSASWVKFHIVCVCVSSSLCSSYERVECLDLRHVTTGVVRTSFGFPFGSRSSRSVKAHRPLYNFIRHTQTEEITINNWYYNRKKIWNPPYWNRQIASIIIIMWGGENALYGGRNRCIKAFREQIKLQLSLNVKGEKKTWRLLEQETEKNWPYLMS